MLQQTRVAVVRKRFVEFMEHFPDIASLAEADEDRVLACWSGMGYYRRVRLLQAGARAVMREFGGVLPRTAAQLRTLPGIGDYTAAAVASIAFREPVAAVDGNVERVLLRLLGLAENRSGKALARLARVAQELMPRASERKSVNKKAKKDSPPADEFSAANAAGDHNQAMMELGATICLPRGPLCLECPVYDFCQTRGEHVTVPRDQPVCRTVAHLLALRKRGTATEVLLERRAADAALMPAMLELPALPLDAVEDREPVLRLRHSITNTSYYAMIFSESAVGSGSMWPAAQDEPDAEQAHETQSQNFETAIGTEIADSRHVDETEPRNEDEEVFVGTYTSSAHPLLDELVTAPSALTWVATSTLVLQPLTGLTRKALQRLGVMAVEAPRIGSLPS
jgi:A/G-specific adenine glycosylase